MKDLIGIVLLTLCVVGVLYNFVKLFQVSWSTHFDMIFENTDYWRIGTYQDFIREFSKREWSRDEHYPCSFFYPDICSTDYDKNKIHASIFIFDGVGMLFFDFWEYRKVQRFLKDNKY